MMVRFSKSKQAIDYAEKGWKLFWSTFTEKQRLNILSVKSKGRRVSDSFDRPVIEALRDAMNRTPLTEDTLVVYRGGYLSDFCEDRPFLATSFLKSVAKDFAKRKGSHLYKIIICKGTPILPICGMGELGCEAECEVIIETGRLRRKPFSKTFYYERKDVYEGGGLNLTEFPPDAPIVGEEDKELLEAYKEDLEFYEETMLLIRQDYVNANDISLDSYEEEYISFPWHDNTEEDFERLNSRLVEAIPYYKKCRSFEDASKVTEKFPEVYQAYFAMTIQCRQDEDGKLLLHGDGRHRIAVAQKHGNEIPVIIFEYANPRKVDFETYKNRQVPMSWEFR